LAAGPPLDHKRRQNADDGRKRRLFGAPAVPDAADTVPTASAIIDIAGNEPAGVRLAISGAPGRTSARVTRPKSPNGPLAGAPEPLQPPKSPGEPLRAPAQVECRGSLARSASKSSRTCCGGPSCLKSPIRQFSFTGTLSGQAALKRPQKADPRAWGRVARVRGVRAAGAPARGPGLTFYCTNSGPDVNHREDYAYETRLGSATRAPHAGAELLTGP